MASEIEIDDSLYSRQRYVLGDGAMKRMAQSSVLLYGLGGLGVEIAKNIVLAGVKSLTIQDCKVTSTIDLGSQFFLRDEDVQCKRNRAEASTSRIAELNPYVSIKTLTTPLDDTTDLTYLASYQCVILTDISLSTQLRVNNFCRSQNPQIQFISADVFGVFCGAFCDFGDQFEIADVNGEEPKSIFVDKITKDNPGKVSCLDNRFHGFEEGDSVTFKEVKGMTVLNDRQFKIDVINPYTFSICDTTGDDFHPYESGGIATQVKIPQIASFKSLESQIQNPNLLTPDLSKLEAPSNIHLGFLALHKFQEKNQRLPNVWCQTDAAQVLSFAQELNNQMSNRVDPIDESLIRCLSYTCQGSLAPLCAAIGGFVAQEGLKALTGKFTPLNQWLYFDASEVIAKLDYMEDNLFHMRGDRMDALRICVGENVCKILADLKLFMIGCGAIGCELLKIYALLGVGSGSGGLITITDNDLIEKSNLNRQFLFRPQHIRQPKSTTAAQSVLEINPALKIHPQQNKVCPQTEEKNYNDAFFEEQDLIVNALDNVEARRYVDSRVVTNRKPLLESGTMGTKGHVQVIMPDITESYASQNDPQDSDVPFCTLKSFPQSAEHCIQWARDKFESSFSLKPAHFNKFWSTNSSPEEVIQKLSDNIMLEGVVQCSKILKNRPTTWEDCVTIGRLKFEKYFNHRAKQLLHSFPEDTLLSDGSPFWQSPKRPPVPVDFDVNNPIHMGFVSSTARLFADIAGVRWSEQDLAADRLCALLSHVNVPKFVPANKRIVVDENVTREEASTAPAEDEMEESAQRIKSFASQSQSQIHPMVPLEFEKDDDANGHIDYITAASNLRAMMYRLDCVDRLKVKRIAGRIVPAIATTTAAVAGLVSIELLKVIEKMPVEKLKNTFLNLALPIMLFSEPGPAEKSVIREGLSFTMWDKWEVHGNAKFTLQQFLDHFKNKYQLEASVVVHGVKMIFVPVMPGHMKRLPHTMVKLLKPGPSIKYVDLIVSFDGEDDEDIPGPPIRYFFGL